MSLVKMPNPDKTHLCDCVDECPAHPRERLFHVGNQCYHTDGTHHKIYEKKRS